jgi:hypothetical protein
MWQRGRFDETELRANENGDSKNMKMLLSLFACYEQSDWSKHLFVISLYINEIRSPTGDPATYQQRRESERFDLDYIVLEHG